MYCTVPASHLRAHLWRDEPSRPAMVVASSCYDWRRGALRTYEIPPQCRLLVCDSGGYAFATRGGYPFSPAEYTSWLDALCPVWAATMDYPLGPDATAREVRAAQLHTTALAGLLMRRHRPWSWLPVLQGRIVEDYRAHAALYLAEGLATGYMGIGSLVGRRAWEVASIVAALGAVLPGVRWHLFGVKLGLLRQGISLGQTVASADTGAWNGRFGADIQGFDAVKREKGWTQDETEIRYALPRYWKKIDAAMGRPQQAVLF